MRDTSAIDDSPTSSGGPATAATTGSPAAVPAPAGSGDPLAAVVDTAGAVLGAESARELAGWDTDDLRARVQLLRRLEGLAATGLARAVRALEAAGGVAQDGASSTSSWLQAATGRSGREAARLARLASTLDELPHTAEALAGGALTVEAADAIVQAARDARLGPAHQVDAELVPVAVDVSPEQLRAEIRRRTQTAEATAMLDAEARQHDRRRLALTRRDDGMWDLFGRLPCESGDRLRTLLDIFDTADEPETPRELRRRPDQRLADALDTAVGVALDHGDLPTDGGIARPHVSVLVDLPLFDANLTDPDHPDRPIAPDHVTWAGLPPAELAWGGLLSPQAALRICCDAGISRIVTAGTPQVLDVGRQTRVWSAPQRRAINTRDRACRGPACQRPIAWTQIHHIRWWEDDGPTDVDNGLALCSACHRLVHELGWTVELDPVTAAATWTCPDRRRTTVTHPRRPG